MFFLKFPRSRKMLAPLHGPIEKCPQFNGLNIEIFHDSTSCWKKCKLWKCCLSTQITEWQIHDICVALTTCVFQSHSGCGAPTDSRVQVIFTYRRNYILAIKYEVIIAFHCNLHGIYIYIYIYIYLIFMVQRCYQICKERRILQDIRWAVDELLICNAN